MQDDSGNVLRISYAGCGGRSATYNGEPNQTPPSEVWVRPLGGRGTESTIDSMASMTITDPKPVDSAAAATQDNRSTRETADTQSE